MQRNKNVMANISVNGEVCLGIIKNKQDQDHEMISFHQPPCQEYVQMEDMEAKRQEEKEAAVASILVDTIEEAETPADVTVPGIMETEGQEGEIKRHIKFQLPNNASYLVDRNCGQKLDKIISTLLKRRSQKLSSFEAFAFASETEPLDLDLDCSTLHCSEVLVRPRVLFRLQLLDKVTHKVKAMETEVIEEVLSTNVAKHGLNLADLEVSVSRYGGNLESVDLRESVTTIDNTLVVVRSMTAAADQTQELVNGDECLEPPPRSSTPVPGHNEDISDLFHNTTDILFREHSYSRGWSVSSSGPQNSKESVKSVSGYHSLSVSEVERAEADQRQVIRNITTSPGLSGYMASVSASCPTNQSLSPPMDATNQRSGSFGGGGISSRASTVTGAASPRDTVIHPDHDGTCEKNDGINTQTSNTYGSILQLEASPRRFRKHEIPDLYAASQDSLVFNYGSGRYGGVVSIDDSLNITMPSEPPPALPQRPPRLSSVSPAPAPLPPKKQSVAPPSIHEVTVPGSVTTMADFVFTSVIRAPDGEFINQKGNNF